jgi:hypothetical protein
MGVQVNNGSLILGSVTIKLPPCEKPEATSILLRVIATKGSEEVGSVTSVDR